jgi:hypothetical protein
VVRNFIRPQVVFATPEGQTLTTMAESEKFGAPILSIRGDR